ncbi:WD repeat domain-containing protein 83 [Nilaparvata lugens]|uniref:WD repeat domain-containing protein 83 n=1 Tax=Nilaparvata lugens TaxID=108931 RepID=UPI00193D7467|nr:WD repeat domain-containing protein 83 [Nilaparvata lugens]
MKYDVLKTIDCKQGAVRAVRFNVDGAYCITCGGDKKLKLWNPHTSLLLKTYGGHGSDVLDACGSCDSSFILSGGSDKTVIVWDVSTGQPIRRLRGHASRVTCVRYNEESTVAFSGSHDNTVMCWDIKSRSNEPIQVLREAKDSITYMQVTNEEILTSSLDCSVRFYDIRKGQITEDFVGEPVTCVNFTRDGQCILVSATDSVIRLFDKTSGELLNEYSGHKTDLVQAEVVGKLVHDEGRTRPIHSLSVHPTAPFLLSASGGSIKLWGTPSAENEEENA